MALKFLNKKGWHTGSLRNIENVWKAEQKHEAEQKKLEELRKQIQEEKERAEFRLLQEQAGLVPKQERLDFLYDSGLSVGKGNSEGFKALETFPKPDDQAAPSSSSAKSSVPGALFEEKPQSANDAWRKLHSDPLLMIRQREQEALARIKKNPVQMAMIRKSVEGEARKHKEKNGDKREGKKHREGKTHRHKNNRLSSGREESDSGIDTDENRKRRTSKHRRADSEAEYGEGGEKRKNHREKKYHDFPGTNHPHESQHKRRKALPKLSEEERAARLREMQVDAELHEEQRWKRLKKAEEDDTREAVRARASAGRSFLDAAQKSVYGAEKGGSSTIEESVRRRAHYSQGRLEAENGNAFRR